MTADISVVEARTLLARAFADDPLMAWFFPDDETRPHACAALFGLFAEHYLQDGRVDVVRRDAPAAVAEDQFVLLLGSTGEGILLTLAALLYNNASGRSYPHISHAPGHPHPPTADLYVTADDLDQTLTEPELLNLVAYLRSRK